MDIQLGRDVTLYLYKCLLRRRQALQLLKPIDKDITQFDHALDSLVKGMEHEDVCEVDKQMIVSEAQDIEVYVDASVKDHDNPEVLNKASVSFVIYENGTIIYEKAQYLGNYIELIVQGQPVIFDITVNIAEYIALIKALEFIVDSDFRGNVTVYSDSQLIVKQVNFNSATRSQKLVVLRDYAKRLKDKLPHVEVAYLCREENTCADALARTVTGEAEDTE